MHLCIPGTWQSVWLTERTHVLNRQSQKDLWKRRGCLPWTLLRHHSVVQERVDCWCHGRAPAGPDIKKRTRILSFSGGHQYAAQATGQKRKIARHLEVRKHSTLSLTCCVISAKSRALFPKLNPDFIRFLICFLMRLIKQYLASGPVPILWFHFNFKNVTGQPKPVWLNG